MSHANNKCIYRKRNLYTSCAIYVGAFPCLEIQFVLQRKLGFVLLQVYVPSMLVVILSWVSFWLNVEASPARVSLGLLTVFTITTQSASVNASLPRVSYIKAIDVWMSACLIFVVFGLLEYAVVNVLSRRCILTSCCNGTIHANFRERAIQQQNSLNVVSLHKSLQNNCDQIINNESTTSIYQHVSTSANVLNFSPSIAVRFYSNDVSRSI